MNVMRLEDQIRNYTEAWYSEAPPIQELLSAMSDDEQLITGQVTVTLPKTRSHVGAWKGVAVAFGAALIVLLAAIPLLLTGEETQPDPVATTGPVASTTSMVTNTSIFLGVWTGDDTVDGSWNTLIVGEGTTIYQETGLTACKTMFDEFVGGQAQGPTTIDGNTLTFTGTLYCNLQEGRTIHPAFENVEWTFTYNPQTETISERRDPDTKLSR